MKKTHKPSVSHRIRSETVTYQCFCHRLVLINLCGSGANFRGLVRFVPLGKNTLLAARAESIVLGDGMAEGTQMGPLCNYQHWQKVTRLVEQSIAEGAVALAGGKPAEGSGQEGGYFFQPTILGDVQHDSTAGQVEIFAPVLSVLEYENFDEAMAMLNGTDFGLTSGLFSNDNACIQRFLAESQHGMMHVNHGTVPDNNMPFGGIKNSGVGAYSVGPTAVNFYTSEHSAYLAW